MVDMSTTTTLTPPQQFVEALNSAIEHGGFADAEDAVMEIIDDLVDAVSVAVMDAVIDQGLADSVAQKVVADTVAATEAYVTEHYGDLR